MSEQQAQAQEAGRAVFFAVAAIIISWLAFSLNFADRVTMATAMKQIMEEMQLTAVGGGSFTSAWYLGYMLALIPGGMLVDRLGYRRVLLGSFVAIGMGSFLMANMTTFTQGLVFRFISGVGAGAVIPCGMRAAFDWFSAKGRGKAVGFFMTGTNCGLALTNLIVPRMLENNPWTMPFYMWGSITLTVGVLAFFLLKQKTPTQVGGKAPVAAPEFFKQCAGLLRNWNLMVVAVAGMGFLWGNVGTQTWINRYMNMQLKIDPVTVGQLVAVYAVTGLICKFLSGVLIDSIKSRKWLLMGMMAFYGCVLVWFGANTIAWMVYILVPLCGLANALPSPLLNIIASESVEPHLRGTAIGLVTALYQVGSQVAPLAVGYAIDSSGGSYSYVLPTLAFGPFMGAVVAVLLKSDRLAASAGK